MTEFKRLFDCIEYQIKLGAIDDMLAAKENGSWKKYSTQQVGEIVNNLAAGLLELGISRGDNSAEGRDKIAILSRNRPEWIMVDLAVQKTGAVLIPIYPTIHVNELEFVLNDAQVKMIFLNDTDLYHKVVSLKDRLPSLKEIFSFDHVMGARHWTEITALTNSAALSKVEQIAADIKPADLATIIYTSGTTGTPKGVMLSHDNVVSNVKASFPCFPPGDNLRALSFLPLNHILERMVTYLYLFRRTSIYYAESLDTIGENAREIKPHMFTSVPRLLEKVYDRIMTAGSKLTGIKRKIFYWSHDLAVKFEINKNQGLLYKIKLAIANKLVFSKWREALGNEIICIVVGGAACQVKLLHIFTAAKISIMEGYGLTETSPVISVNRYDEKGRMFGTVGPLIGGVEVKIAADGEILCKGPNIMMGYYKRPDLTAEAMEDGWYKTGDIGMFVDGKFLKITDRKKEMFKTSGGKYVAPLAIENKLKESMFIENVMVIGAEQKYVGALLIPSFPNLKAWCREQGIDYTTDEQMIHNEKVIELYKDLVENFNKYFNHVEQIKRFELLPYDWNVESGELTPKLSLKRKVIMEKYRDAVERIYK